MKNSHRAAAAALALSCLFAGGTAIAQEREIFTVRVSRAGLDLRTAAGRAAFDARVRNTARWACAPRGTALDYQRELARCTSDMRADAARQLALRFVDKPQQLASLTR